MEILAQAMLDRGLGEIGNRWVFAKDLVRRRQVAVAWAVEDVVSLHFAVGTLDIEWALLNLYEEHGIMVCDRSHPEAISTLIRYSTISENSHLKHRLENINYWGLSTSTDTMHPEINGLKVVFDKNPWHRKPDERDEIHFRDPDQVVKYLSDRLQGPDLSVKGQARYVLKSAD
ncbi:MAG: hypothetical protein IIA87_03015 [Nanoarchaeota archaeon]|nr:hypothetical protein [Nanoarchaeota archaeon]